MNFWDTSAVVPLLVEQARTEAVMSVYADDPDMVAWWGTPVECASAVARLEREEDLSPGETSRALARLETLEADWAEVAPTERVRSVARRLVRVQGLRAADALQLGAALVAAGDDPSTLGFLSLDERLVDAARREGFPIVEVA